MLKGIWPPNSSYGLIANVLMVVLTIVGVTWAMAWVKGPERVIGRTVRTQR
ncbi:MAG TPA: hypothetical protein VHM70_28770 [Polyangiaceae bacterium]|jgi:hypothetical protein|nr:hypothetical protein [Polyangiaceae bacterium]